MSFVRLLVLVTIVSAVATGIGLWAGIAIGKQSGYRTCLSEQDDDQPKPRRMM